MVMDFIGDQDRARSQTGRLVGLFLLAVLGTVAAVYFTAAAVAVMSSQRDEEPLGWWIPELLLAVGGGTLLVILIGSLVKMAQLSSGGKAVAEALGGTLVHPDERDPDCRKLLNVVEEMSIASGCPVPPVYIMDDPSINAFAAGFGFDSAVIGVTRGCVQQLSRDELQGVIAHEFSHIVHGDMKLNIRLTGLIFGIMAIGFIGYIAFRFIGPVLLYSRGGGKNNPGPALGIGVIVAGLLLMAIGGLGTFAARLIQAAVSRQREFLADAAAVDYTRNPAGIAGALRRIGGFPTNNLEQAAASEFQHFFFTSALSTSFATHPPLVDRIARIENRTQEDVGRQIEDAPSAAAPPVSGSASMSGQVAGFAGAAGAAFAVGSGSREVRGADEVRESLSHLGDADADHLAYARVLISSLPEAVRRAVHDTIGAKAVCLLLLVDPDSEIRHTQAAELSKTMDSATIEEIQRLRNPVAGIVSGNPELRLVLVDLAMPALARMDESDSKTFLQAVEAMQGADGRIDRFEWLLGRLLSVHFDRLMGGRSTRTPKANRSITMLEDPARIVLAMIAWGGARDDNQALAAFQAGARHMNLGDLDFPDRSDCSVTVLDQALDRLKRLRWKDRSILLDAAVDAICADGQATIGEVELLRALASTLDCPMPPVLPGRVSS
ncbi:MAG: M48 family metallopeptidase [Phycisphaerales bacterium]|nr:M48 family metallopeptidase [Phycisphaerales bacterium]